MLFPVLTKMCRVFSIFGNPTILERLEDCPCSHDSCSPCRCYIFHGGCSATVTWTSKNKLGGISQIETLLGIHPFISHTTCHVSRHPWYQSIIAGEALCEWWKPHGKTAQPNHCSPRLSLHPNGLLRVAGSALWCDSVICDQDAATWLKWQHTKNRTFPISNQVLHLLALGERDTYSSLLRKRRDNHHLNLNHSKSSQAPNRFLKTRTWTLVPLEGNQVAWSLGNTDGLCYLPQVGLDLDKATS